MDKRDGFGEMWWPGGNVYRGQWKDDLQDGEGKVTENGVVTEATWVKGQMHGKVKILGEKGIEEARFSGGRKVQVTDKIVT